MCSCILGCRNHIVQYVTKLVFGLVFPMLMRVRLYEMTSVDVGSYVVASQSVWGGGRKIRRYVLFPHVISFRFPLGAGPLQMRISPPCHRLSLCSLRECGKVPHRLCGRAITRAGRRHFPSVCVGGGVFTAVQRGGSPVWDFPQLSPAP